MNIQEISLNKRPRVALVLGSGGLKCAASLGLWRVLQRENIPIDMVVGCSGGSLFAASIALGFGTQATEEYLRRGWTHRNLTRYRFSAFLQLLLPKWFGFERGFGLLDDRGFMQLWEEVFARDSVLDILARFIHLQIEEKRDDLGLWKGFEVPLLEGDDDWPAVMKALDEIGYHGWGIAEQDGGDSPEGLRDLAQRMDRIFAS